MSASSVTSIACFDCRSTAAAAALFQDRTTEKTYLAMVEGHVQLSSFPVAATVSTEPEAISDITSIRKPLTAYAMYRQRVFEARARRTQALAVLAHEDVMVLAVPSWSKFISAAHGKAPSTAPPQKWSKRKHTGATSDAASAHGGAPGHVVSAVEGCPAAGTPATVLPEGVYEWAAAYLLHLQAMELVEIERYRKECKVSAAAELVGASRVKRTPDGGACLCLPV